MPRPRDWRTVNVPDGIDDLIHESELCRLLGLTSYGGYRLRKGGIIQPIARSERGLLYHRGILKKLAAYRNPISETRAYLLIDGSYYF